MQKKALVVIDIQNDTSKNYKEIIDTVNRSIDWALAHDIHVVYVRHENLSDKARVFRPNTRGSELASDLKIASKNIFTKYKQNACTSEEFMNFIKKNGIGEFYLLGADATICVKSTCYNLTKDGYEVTVLSDCITSYDKRKVGDMLQYYESKGCMIMRFDELLATTDQP